MRPAAARFHQVGVVTGQIGDRECGEERGIGGGILDAGEMAGTEQVARGFGRDCRGDGRRIGQVGRNAAAHLAGKLEIEFADLFLRVSKEMRRRQKDSFRARAAGLPRQAERVIQPDRSDTRVERHAAALGGQIQQTGALFQAEGGVLAGRRKQGDPADVGGTEVVDQFEGSAKIEVALLAARGEGGNDDTVVFSHAVSAVLERRF